MHFLFYIKFKGEINFVIKIKIKYEIKLLFKIENLFVPACSVELR